MARKDRELIPKEIRNDSRRRHIYLVNTLNHYFNVDVSNSECKEFYALLNDVYVIANKYSGVVRNTKILRLEGKYKHVRYTKKK